MAPTPTTTTGYRGGNFTAGACRCTRPGTPAKLHTYGDPACADAARRCERR
jgi:hypothetical protein